MLLKARGILYEKTSHPRLFFSTLIPFPSKLPLITPLSLSLSGAASSLTGIDRRLGRMGSSGSPNSWAPYDSYGDCSQGICSIYCPQWCYMVFPPPPPFVPPDEDADSTPNFSPLIIAVIGILASAFLLTTYYTVISKYCNRARRNRDDHQNSVPEFESSRNQTNRAQAAGSTGLDETLIKSIAVCKYKKGDGLVEGTECSVCLSEFQEDESLRLLPKCSHAFHLNCIDTWLKSQSNCPLCRASVVKLPPPTNSSVQTSSSTLNVISSLQIQPQNDLILLVDNDDDHRDQRVHSEEEEEEEVDTAQQIRRSISLGSFAFRGHLLVADILHISEDDEDLQMGIPTGVGTSRGEGSSSWGNSRNEVLRRSITTGRVSFRKA